MHSNLLFSPVAVPHIAAAADKRRPWCDGPTFTIISVVISGLYFTKCYHTYNFISSLWQSHRQGIMIIFTHLYQAYLDDRPRPHNWLYVGTGTRRQVFKLIILGTAFLFLLFPNYCGKHGCIVRYW